MAGESREEFERDRFGETGDRMAETRELLDRLQRALEFGFVDGGEGAFIRSASTRRGHSEYVPSPFLTLEQLRRAVSPEGASPALPDLVRHLTRQSAWSARTFGPGDRTAGVIDHIRKELREIEAKPDDLSEWIDVIILGFDGAWRSGHTPEQIVAALVAKQAKNEAREWPDWRTMPADKAIEHVRSEGASPAHSDRCMFQVGPKVWVCAPECPSWAGAPSAPAPSPDPRRVTRCWRCNEEAPRGENCPKCGGYNGEGK